MTLLLKVLFLSTLIVLGLTKPSLAVSPNLGDVDLVPHKALYDINLVATRSGSQVLNISGQMFYEWKPTCDAWITDHRFNLYYEYSDSPGMRITSDFSTFESFDGETFNFSSRRKRDGDLYQELRGIGTVNNEEQEASFNMPEGLKYDLKPKTLFPMAHTIETIKHVREGSKFFAAHVFDGSDEEGPIEINTFIGKPVNAMAEIQPSANLDMSLINTSARKIRMAVFPETNPESVADYEMSMIFHENGIISDMLIEYDDFSVKQDLVALEKLNIDACKDN